MRYANKICMALGLALAIGVAPADAQGKNKEKKDKDKGRVEQQRRDVRGARRQVERERRELEDARSNRRDDREYDRRDNREYDGRDDRDDERYQDGRRRGVPPGWCIGRGNPHNTAANCGTRGERYDPRYDPRYDTRDTRRDDRDVRYGDYDDRNSGNYEERHAYYHRTTDRECRARASQRPLDVRWQLQIRNECNAAHDRWHSQSGTSHDSNYPVLRRRN